MFVTSDVVLSTYVEPLIIHVLSMKYGHCALVVVCGEMLLKFLTKVAVIQNFRVVVTVRLEPKIQKPN